MSAQRSKLSPWIVITCMGRLRHLQQTLSAALRNTNFGVCLVDYSCPEQSGDWAEQTFSAEVASQRLLVERVPGETEFHKTRALNIGARRAIAAAATHLCFVDADTYVLPGFSEWLLAELDGQSMFIAGLSPEGREVAELYGLLALPADLFERSGGYDEGFQGWGCEDLEMRLRLLLRFEAKLREVPPQHLAFLQHPFALRSRHYTEQRWSISNGKNLERLQARVLEWTGGTLAELNDSAKRLTMQFHPVIYTNGTRLQHFERDPGR